MIDKTNTEGMKLFVGGEEVTKEQVEKAISDYEEKISSPEFRKEVEEFAEFLNAGKEKKSTYKYYRLILPPHTIFKMDQENLVSYKFDEEKKCWIEFPTFLTDIEYGNIRADEISFDDGFPIISAVDQSKGIKL